MAWCIGVLCAESGSKGVDGTQCRCTQFAFQLSGNRKRGLLTEEIIVVDDFPVIVLFQVVEILGGHLKHIACSLTVASCNQRRMEIEETMLMEIGVDSHGHVVADAHDSTKHIGTQAQMSMLAHILKTLSFLLHRIVSTASAINLNAFALDFAGLTLSWTLYQSADHTDA